jgi:hypothetical protein
MACASLRSVVGCRCCSPTGSDRDLQRAPHAARDPRPRHAAGAARRGAAEERRCRRHASPPTGRPARRPARRGPRPPRGPRLSNSRPAGAGARAASRWPTDGPTATSPARYSRRETSRRSPQRSASSAADESYFPNRLESSPSATTTSLPGLNTPSAATFRPLPSLNCLRAACATRFARCAPELETHQPPAPAYTNIRALAHSPASGPRVCSQPARRLGAPLSRHQDARTTRITVPNRAASREPAPSGRTGARGDLLGTRSGDVRSGAGV